MISKMFKKALAVLTLLTITMLNIPLTAWAVEKPPAPVLKKAFPVEITSSRGIKTDFIQLFWQVDDKDVDGFKIYQNGKLIQTISTKKAKTEVSGEQGFGVRDSVPNLPVGDYTYQVRSYKGSYLSEYSNALTVKLRSKVDNVAPTIPTNLTILNIKPTSVIIKWNKSSDDQFASIGAWSLLFGKKPEDNVNYGLLVNGVELKDLTKMNIKTVGGLTPGTQYNLSVYAIDSRKNKSGLSQNLSVVTLNDTTSVKGVTSAGLGGGLLSLGTKLHNSLNNFSLKGTTDKLFRGKTIKNALAGLNSLKSSLGVDQLLNKIKF